MSVIGGTSSELNPSLSVDVMIVGASLCLWLADPFRPSCHPFLSNFPPSYTPSLIYASSTHLNYPIPLVLLIASRGPLLH